MPGEKYGYDEPFLIAEDEAVDFAPEVPPEAGVDEADAVDALPEAGLDDTGALEDAGAQDHDSAAELLEQLGISDVEAADRRDLLGDFADTFQETMGDVLHGAMDALQGLFEREEDEDEEEALGNRPRDDDDELLQRDPALDHRDEG